MQSEFHDPFEQARSPFATGKPAGKKRIPWWGWLFVILCGAVPVVALGGAVPVLIGVSGISACIAVARNLRANPVLGAIICFGISTICWGAFVALLVTVFMIQGGNPADLARRIWEQDRPAAQPARGVPGPRPSQFPGPVREPAAPLTAAINQQSLAELQRLLDAGIDPNVPERGRYPLVLVVQTRQYAMATLLLEKGADPNRPADPQFPLGAAVQSRDAAMIELLIKQGADPNAGTRQGQSLLGYALGRNWSDIAELLSQHGAKLQDAV